MDPGPAVLWTGDAPAMVLENFINEACPKLKEITRAVIIYQFPHHGSAGSVSPQWLDEIGKSFPLLMSVISAGRSNAFGHPSPEALWRLPAKMISEGSYPFEASFEWR